jgi:hypothetical protein
VAGALQVQTDFGKPDYGEPCPPESDHPHRYFFTVHAVSMDKLPVAADTAAAVVGFYLNFNTLANKPVPVADGTYTVGIGTVQNGTITVVNGIITAIQEASSTPAATPVFVGSGFEDTPVNGNWYADVAEARVGDQYKFLLTTAKGEFKRIDPYAREVTNSVGNAIVHDPSFDWKGDEFQLAPWNEIVIYELHVGTFNEKDDNIPGQFAAVSTRLGHLKKLGVNAIQIMPTAEFAGERSWGYNPSHIFAVETAYGGPSALKRFVKRAHAHGIAVMLVSFTTTWDRATSFCGCSTAGRRTVAAASTSITTKGPTHRGATPGPITDAARSVNTSSITPPCGLRNITWTASASTALPMFAPLAAPAARICPMAGACSRRSTAWSLRNTPAGS